MTPFLIVVGLLALSALFSSSELAIMGVPLYKIKRLINDRPEYNRAKQLIGLRVKTDRTLVAILIGNNLVNVALSIYAANLGDTILAGVALTGAVGFLIVSVTITFLILFFGEIIPKVFATKYALDFALAVTPVINFIIYLLYPFVYVLEVVIGWIHSLLGTHVEKVSRDDIEIFVEEGKKQDIFSSVEAMIIHNFLEFRERAVESILTHRTELFSLCEESTLDEAIAHLLKRPYSRIPIYRGDKDHIVSLMTLRDVLNLSQEKNVGHKKLKEFGFTSVSKVPVTANVFDVFLDMKKNGWHFAVVIDEHGGTEGIITFEDILEDLVGAIRDESDDIDEGDIIRENATTLKVKGGVVFRDVIDAFQLNSRKMPEELTIENISEEDVVSYIIIFKLKDFAKKGDIVHIGNISLEVIEVNKYGDKILKVKVCLNLVPEKKEKE